MTERTWGYASQVGRWEGIAEVPTELRGRSVDAAVHILDCFLPALAELHRPTTIQLTWLEYHNHPTESTVHELVETPVTGWDDLRQQLRSLNTGTDDRVDLRDLFIHLETCVTESTGDAWVGQSGMFQITLSSTDPGHLSAAVSYTTFIDVWLSTTYGEHYRPQSNTETSKHNRPRLRAFLLRFAELVGDSFRTDLSRLYYFAITPTGFRDSDDIPVRTRVVGERCK